MWTGQIFLARTIEICVVFNFINHWCGVGGVFVLICFLF